MASILKMKTMTSKDKGSGVYSKYIDNMSILKTKTTTYILKTTTCILKTIMTVLGVFSTPNRAACGRSVTDDRQRLDFQPTRWGMSTARPVANVYLTPFHLNYLLSYQNTPSARSNKTTVKYSIHRYSRFSKECCV